MGRKVEAVFKPALGVAGALNGRFAAIGGEGGPVALGSGAPLMSGHTFPVAARVPLRHFVHVRKLQGGSRAALFIGGLLGRADPLGKPARDIAFAPAHGPLAQLHRLGKQTLSFQVINGGAGKTYAVSHLR